VARIKQMKNFPRIKRFALSALYVLAIIAGLGLIFGPRGYAAGIIVSILFFTWRHDNAVGAFLPLAFLFVITLLVMFLLIYLMMITHH
jgi:hypothetical protein